MPRKDILVTRVNRDAKGEITVKYPIGKMPIMLPNETSEIGIINCVHITAFYLDFDKNSVQIMFRLGAHASDGSFHCALQFGPAVWVIPKDFNNGIQWNKYIKGRTTYDIEEIMDWAVAENALPVLALNNWGIPDLNVEYVK
jgi:hypothetical protein